LSQPEIILKKYWGYDAFRGRQREIIEHILNGKDCLALMPTGGGKSLCYQIPALLNEGLCLVVSPLISLMQDQVNRLHSLGISAAVLFAGMSNEDVEDVLLSASKEQYKFLYVSPERLQSPLLKAYLEDLPISLIAVDEAHCISQWGYDFRPDYLKIATLKYYFPKVPILALTASATNDVQLDIQQQLKQYHPIVVKQSFSRPNLRYTFSYTDNKIGELLDWIQRVKGCSIVYCRSRKQTEILCQSLLQTGLKAVYYHAGMKKEMRQIAQEAWMQNECNIIVATTAFGMGIDKADVRLVVHYDPPEHPEAYYQEAGRAGRDGQLSYAICLFNKKDIKRLEESTAIQFPEKAFLQQVYQHICEYLQLPIGAEPNRYFPFDLSAFCERFQLNAVATVPALRLLEQEGLWSISESVFLPPTIEITIDRYAIDQIVVQFPQLGLVITTLLRMYALLFNHPTKISLPALAKHLKMPQDTVVKALMQLNQMEVLQFTPAKEGAHILFQHRRTESQHLLIDMQRIQRLRAKHQQRIHAMISLMTSTHCSEQFILQYFGEKATSNCGHCANCLNKKNKDWKRCSIDILSLLSNNPLSIESIHKILDNEYSKQEIITCLRNLLENEKINRNENGLFLTK